MILRYDDVEVVITRRDPFDDLCCWISGLRSLAYTQDLLSEKHKFAIARVNREAAIAVGSHAELAIHLIEQAQEGNSDVSFLPIYYALLNLSKIYVILAGRLGELQIQRWHGATYSGASKTSQDLMTDTITVKSKGSIPLLYNVITGSAVHRNNVTLKMQDIFPYIIQVNYEITRLFKRKESFESIRIDFEEEPSGSFRLVAIMNREEGVPTQKRELRILGSFRLDTNRTNVYITPSVKGSEKEVKKRLLGNLRRYLLYTTQDNFGQPHCSTPISNRQFLWPEELPILLAFFHMSNVVRYNPEFLEKLKDSRAWTLLLVLRNHAPLSFLELFWSNLMKAHYLIRR